MWTVALEGGPRRVNHAAARVGMFIYSFGGYSSTDDLDDWDPITVHILDTHTLRWFPEPCPTNNRLPTIPYHRYGHSVVVYDDKIYMWGGRNSSEAFDAIMCFDPPTSSWSEVDARGSCPLAKDGHSACVVNKKMYIFGGFEFITNQYSQDLHCFDFETSQWTSIGLRGELPIPRDFHSAVAVGDCMYVFGGRAAEMMEDYDYEVYCRNVFCYNTVTEIWTCLNTKGDIPEGRRSHSAWTYDNNMYIFGGYNGITRKHYNDIHRMSLKELKWETVKVLGEGPCERRRQCCVMNRDKMYLFGGTSPYPHRRSRDSEKTIDNSDLHILDYNVSLRTLCIKEVLKNNCDLSYLPSSIQMDIRAMTLHNNIAISRSSVILKE